MQDNNEKLKIQVESYKKRLGAVTREKREYEEKFLKLTHEIQKKVRGSLYHGIENRVSKY